MLWIVLIVAYFLIALVFCIALGMAARKPLPAAENTPEGLGGAADLESGERPHYPALDPGQV